MWIRVEAKQCERPERRSPAAARSLADQAAAHGPCQSVVWASWWDDRKRPSLGKCPRRRVGFGKPSQCIVASSSSCARTLLASFSPPRSTQPVASRYIDVCKRLAQPGVRPGMAGRANKAKRATGRGCSRIIGRTPLPPSEWFVCSCCCSLVLLGHCGGVRCLGLRLIARP